MSEGSQGLALLLLGLVAVLLSVVLQVAVKGSGPVVSVSPTVSDPYLEVLYIEDAFVSTSTNTVAVTSPSHVPRLGTWASASFATLPAPEIGPATEYCVAPEGVSAAFAQTAITGYQAATDTLRYELHPSFPSAWQGSGGTAALAAYQVDVSTYPTFTLLVLVVGYNDAEGAMYLQLNEGSGGTGSSLGLYTLPAPVFDTALQVTLAVTPTGSVTVALDGTAVLQVTTSLVSVLSTMTTTLIEVDRSVELGLSTRLHYFSGSTQTTAATTDVRATTLLLPPKSGPVSTVSAWVPHLLRPSA